MDNFVFPLVILLAKGKRLALAPLYLGSLFDWLDECVCNIVHSVGHCDVVAHADTAFLQMFISESWGCITKSPRIPRSRDD